MKKMKRVLHYVGSENLMLITIGVTAFTVLSILMPYRFFSLNNVNNMLFQAAELGILSIAIALPIVIAGIDLSIVSTANLTAICIWHAVRLIPSPALHIPAAVVIVLVLGTLLGAVNGLLTAKAKIPPILATLGTMTLYSGISIGITGGATVAGLPPGLKQIGMGTFLGLPIPIYVLIVCFLAAAWILNRTPFGFKMYLLGCNSKVTRFSGYNNDKITMVTYMLSGLLAAAAGFVILCRSNSAYADYGKSYITLTILIVVLGGIAVTGGKGRISGVVLAVFLMQVFSTGFNMLLLPYGNSNFFKDFLYGVLLIAILVLKPAVSSRFGKKT